MKYYRMLDNMRLDNRWFLGKINFKLENDVWTYRKAGFIKNPQKNLEVSIIQKGVPLDITMAEFEILIGNKRAADIFQDDQVQKIKISVRGIERDEYFILVVRNEIDCLDRLKSEFTLWEENNSIRPDLAGKYRMISKIIIDPSLMNNLDIIRIKDFNVAVIVSEKIKEEFESKKVVGVLFKDV